jgi:pimeloyl-ACP methyl ester carboxylesterase
MVSIVEEAQTIRIDGGQQDMSRPSERPPKTNWKIEMLKKGVGVLQHLSPTMASEIIWQHFTRPGRSRFTPAQRQLIEKAEMGVLNYKGDEIVTYRWGTGSKKILLSHGWNSKAADFRRMIERLVEEGYTVEGLDMRGHGKSGGLRTGVPEMREVLKNYYVKNGPYDTVIGYSIGGMTAGIMASELSPGIQPPQLIIIAAPSYTRYFFKDTIDELGYSPRVYQEMCEMIYKTYNESVDYFDLRKKLHLLKGIDMHLIYDEDDATVPFIRGQELRETYRHARFVHTTGLGHYNIIKFPEVIDYITKAINERHKA